jgi:hypothetical protein
MEPRSLQQPGVRPGHRLRTIALCGVLAVAFGGVFVVAEKPDDAFQWTLIAVLTALTWAWAFLCTTAWFDRVFGRPAAGLALQAAGLGILVLVTAQDDLTDWILIFLAIMGCTGALLTTGYWRLWVFWLPHPKQTGPRLIASTTIAICFFMALFSVVTGYLYVHGTLTGKGADLPSHPFFKLEEDYGWHFCDAIPALKVTETLNWAEPVKLTDPISGMLLLSFKLLVILPVVGLVTELVKTSRRKRQESRGPVSVP